MQAYGMHDPCPSAPSGCKKGSTRNALHQRGAEARSSPVKSMTWGRCKSRAVLGDQMHNGTDLAGGGARESNPPGDAWRHPPGLKPGRPTGDAAPPIHLNQRLIRDF
jgi:hypothetical protein